MKFRLILSLFILILVWLVSACSSPTLQSQSSQQKKPLFRVAAVQFPVEGQKRIPEFLEKFERLTLEAVRGGAKLIIFPELFSLDGWPIGDSESEEKVTYSIAREFTPAIHKKAVELSRKYQVSILAGSSPSLVRNQIYNTAVLVFPNGEVITQDKIFLTGWEKKMGWKSGETLKVFDAPWGRSTILICFDSEFPLLSNLLARHQPEVLLIPSMTESEDGLNRVRWSAQARAVEHYSYVVVSGTVGSPTPDWNHYGQGVILSPWEGKFKGVVNEGKKNQSDIVYSDLDLARLRESRSKSNFFPAQEQEGRTVTIKPSVMQNAPLKK